MNVTIETVKGGWIVRQECQDMRVSPVLEIFCALNTLQDALPRLLGVETISKGPGTEAIPVDDFGRTLAIEAARRKMEQR
jgi:hypothetical protein